jgi:uncharacterized membrane protein
MRFAVRSAGGFQNRRFAGLWCLSIALVLAVGPAAAQQVSAPEAKTATGLIDFQRDVAPILVDHCLECHGPKDAKQDLRVDDRDALLGYIEPGKVEVSTLWTDYLRATDEDHLMPPREHGGPLSPPRLAVIKTWIEEGATWPENASLTSATALGQAAANAVNPPAIAPTTPAGRIWAFQGYFHPAVVHFPVGLLLTSALFVVVGVVWPAIGKLPAKACLVVGALTSVVACAMGFALAEQQGYGGWQRGMDAQVFWHRWGGVAVAVIACIVAVLAVVSHERGTNTLWKLSVLLLAGLVGWVGHEGGELTYGAGFYDRAFQLLRGDTVASQPVVVDQMTADGTVAETPAGPSDNPPQTDLPQNGPPQNGPPQNGPPQNGPTPAAPAAPAVDAAEPLDA